MNPTLKNIIAVIAGALIGGLLNLGLIYLSPYIIPPPEGTDLTTPEGIKAAMPLLEAKHFIMPFLAHALGTLLGAFIAAKYSANNHLRSALIVGALFLAGGIMMIVSVPGPTWFSILDLGVAYFPMAWLGWKFAK